MARWPSPQSEEYPDTYEAPPFGVAAEGSVEDPMAIQTMTQSVPVHVVSSVAKPGKAIGAEFGRWRTFVFTTSQLSQDTATAGAKRIVNRSLRRHRFLLKVNGVGTVGSGLPAQPSFPGSTVPVQNTNTFPATVVVSGTTGTQVTVNGIVVNSTSANGTYLVPSGATIAITYTVAGTWTWFNANTTQPQTSTDGVIIGAPGEILSGGGPVGGPGTPMTPGQVGGYLQIGDSYRIETQAEYWAAPCAGNSGTVYVTICDEIYASDPEAWREEQ